MPDARPRAAGRQGAATLVRAYAAARAAPGNAGARLALATALLRAGRHDLARRHAHRAARWAAPGWPGTFALAALLFKLGAFDDAGHALIAGLRHDQTNAEALRILSTLLTRAGDPTGARRCLATAARRAPLTGPRYPDPDKPAILRLRALDNSHYAIVQGTSGLFRRGLRRGHFSTRDLIDHDRYTVHIATLFGDTLDRVGRMPAFGLVINTVACADLNPDALHRMDRFLATHADVPVINHPRRVLETTRARNHQRLGTLDGVRFPRTELFRTDARPAAVADRLERRGFTYPLIVRRPGTQTGTSMVKLDDRAALLSHLAATPRGTPLYAIQFVDCRGPRGLYHKTRAFFIDGVFYPVANLTNDTWQIHSGDRYRVMSGDPATQEAERAYLDDPEAYLGAQAFGCLHAIARVIGLDFFGVDFTLDHDGRVLVFEANAAMRHNFDHADAFPYTRPHLQRISRAFGAMVDRRLGLGVGLRSP